MEMACKLCMANASFYSISIANSIICCGNMRFLKFNTGQNKDDQGQKKHRKKNWKKIFAANKSISRIKNLCYTLLSDKAANCLVTANL